MNNISMACYATVIDLKNRYSPDDDDGKDASEMKHCVIINI